MAMTQDENGVITVTDEDVDKVRNMVVGIALSNYLDNPCPICGKSWENISELIESDAVFAAPYTAAHKACWDARNATEAGNR